MWGSDWRLCARSIPLEPFDFYLVARNTVPVKMWLYQAIPGSLPVLFADAIPTPGMNFPWGEEVEPD